MSPTPSQTALAVLELAQAGEFEQIRDLFPPQLRSMVAAETLSSAWEAELGRRGPVASVGEPVADPAHAGVVVVKVPIVCERGGVTLIESLTEDGQLVGLQLAPIEAAAPIAPWEAPAYVERSAFDEHELTLGDEPFAVGGTLSLPRAAGPLPAVVMLPGSGPNDRDETLGRNRPFKDIAWGLASRGVAVVRFDKVTFAHPAEVSARREFTSFEEYAPQALAAVRLLRGHPAVDPDRVFLLGHSQGGTVAPRIAATEPAIAGVVLLAGGTRPMHWAAVEQMRHIASLDPAGAAASEPAIEALVAKARAVDSPELSPSTPWEDLPFGVPAEYWLDLRAYDAPATAAALGRPILILQGGRDYQATVDGDLAGWRAALDGRPDVTIRVYDEDNHLFFRGSGPSSPAEYEPAQHVDPAVLDDIVTWLDS